MQTLKEILPKFMETIDKIQICRNPCDYVFRKYTMINKKFQLRLQCKNCGRYTYPIKHHHDISNFPEIDHQLHKKCKKGDKENAIVKIKNGKFNDIKNELKLENYL